MDQGHSSKIRALALASRCLTREIRRLKDSPGIVMHDRDASVEIDRLVDLARTILDPGLSEKESRSGRGSEHPRAPLPSTRSKDAANGSPNGTKAGHAHAAAALQELLADDGPPSPDHVLAFLGRGTTVPIPELVEAILPAQATKP